MLPNLTDLSSALGLVLETTVLCCELLQEEFLGEIAESLPEAPDALL